MRSCGNPAIKRGTTPAIQIHLDGVDAADIASVTFLFKAAELESASVLVKKTVEKPESNPIEIVFTQEETYRLPTLGVWMDTRIRLNSGKIPPAELVKLDIGKTLFSQDEEDNGSD